jgi:lysophospholipid acyltransferase (LPLAT)-like uncharacterized protein
MDMTQHGQIEHKSSRRKFDLKSLPFLPRLIAGTIRLHFKSCRFTILGRQYEEEAMSYGGPILCTSWHFAFPAVIYHLRDKNGMVMVSLSRDGEWIARILKHLGYESARGSSNRGGSAALREVISFVKAGHHGGFIADGSQGPARIAQKGILTLSKFTQAPLVPVSMAARPCWRFRSWDRTVLAKPFSRIVLAFGPPIRVDRKASEEDLEKMRMDLQISLNALTQKCEEEVERGR